MNYSDRLAGLLKEVRQLFALGYNVPVKIVRCAETAEKFYRQAVVLKKVQK